MFRKKITGRLGNQMFQYASMLGIKDKCKINSDMYLSFEKVYKRNFKNELDYFCVNYKSVNKINLTLEEKFFFMLFKAIERIVMIAYRKDMDKSDAIRDKLEKKFMPILAKHGILYTSKGYYDFEKLKNIKNNDLYLCGWLESPKYFDHIRNKILKEFTPRNARLEKNADLYKKIENSESVCVTIRRGDFLSDKFKNEHYVCTPEYFYKGIELIRKKVVQPTFFVFSDDVGWCKDNMRFPKGTEFEDGTDPVWEKLRLMYSCKHFIISNSTFSWWAQYLSRNDDKIVIAPKKWKNKGDHKDIYQDNWIKI